MYGEYHSTNLETLMKTKQPSLKADTIAAICLAAIVAMAVTALFFSLDKPQVEFDDNEYVTQRPPPIDAIQQIKDGEYQFYSLDEKTK